MGCLCFRTLLIEMSGSTTTVEVVVSPAVTTQPFWPPSAPTVRELKFSTSVKPAWACQGRTTQAATAMRRLVVRVFMVLERLEFTAKGKNHCTYITIRHSEQISTPPCNPDSPTHTKWEGTVSSTAEVLHDRLGAGADVELPVDVAQVETDGHGGDAGLVPDRPDYWTLTPLTPAL